MVITLHHAEESKRLLWLLEELKLPYELRKGGPKSAKKAADSGIPYGHPPPSPAEGQSSSSDNSSSSTGQGSIYDNIAQAVASSLKGALPPTHSPTIIDNGLTVRESGAIVEYLIDKYGRNRFKPTNPNSRLDNTFFMHYAEGSFLPPLILKQVFQTIYEKSPFFVRPFTSIITNQICKSFIDPANFNNFALLNDYLSKDGGRKWLAGETEPTGGDFMMSVPIESAVTCGAFKAEEIPQSMKDYLERLRARPAYTRVEEMLRKQALGKS